MKKDEEIHHYKEPTLTFEECKQFLCRDGEAYTDEEIEAIRKLILNLVQIEYMNYLRKQASQNQKVIQLNPDKEYKQAS